ncbi:hypothetical protein LNKW23_13720 [Paralimibaculum aggregatum]|uniref:Acyl carrier protein n=1 Tax=Paralimibaculum aggregatum TaxID=3036245 RepID=A0ABQ6LFQ7_9RHOB|nr:acyl carrier protein [Limibaculum sp. NKW23]GMG82159.1 hypothetical protein LNKW23_13720 [Limibaculum sp. NKW23]
MPEPMIQTVIAEIRAILDDEAAEITAETRLIGEAGRLDSMGLVSLCIRLEEIAEEAGFEFDWTSETAMSQSRSVFRNVGSLAAEFEAQRARAAA